MITQPQPVVVTRVKRWVSPPHSPNGRCTEYVGTTNDGKVIWAGYRRGHLRIGVGENEPGAASVALWSTRALVNDDSDYRARMTNAYDLPFRELVERTVGVVEWPDECDGDDESRAERLERLRCAYVVPGYQVAEVSRRDIVWLIKQATEAA